MTQIELTDEMDVTLIDSMGNDLSIVRAAKVSFNKDVTEMGVPEEGLLGFLMREKHCSPLEHVSATMRFEVPIFIAREHMRHRVQAYNEWSARYSFLQPKFYLPAMNRPIHQVGKPGHYKFETGSPDEMSTIYSEMRHVYQTAWNSYEYMVNDCGFAKEVARNCLPVGVYTSYFATANLRGWLNYLSLRTSPDALYEIQDVAFKVELELQKIVPVTMELWDKNGRGPL